MRPISYQRGAVATLNRTFLTAREALIVMATGLGKTFVSALWAKQHLAKGKRGIFLCHEIGILEQSLEAFREVLGDRFSFGVYNGSKRSMHVDLLFATFQSIRGKLSQFPADSYAFEIVDESHHGKAPTFEPVIKHFSVRYLLGMTATPDRMDLEDIREIFGKEVVNIPLEKAITKGWLTPFEYHIVTDNIDQEVLSQLLEKAGHTRKRITLKDINRTLFVRARDKKIAETIRSYGLKTIIFCRNIAHAERFRKFLPGAEVYHSKRSAEQNRATLRRFRSGQCRYILTVNKFNEGMDIPDAELIVFLRTTESLTIFLQQLGRGLRLRPGKKKVIVLDFVANAERMLMLREVMKTMGMKTPGMREREGGRRPVIHISGRGFTFEFTNRQVNLFRLLERTKLQMVADIPELAREYSSRNFVLATHMPAGSNQKLWWKCHKATCGHEWQVTGSKRIRGSRCPACWGRRIATPAYNLQVVHPELAREYSTRNPLRATQVTPGSSQRVWWKCIKHGCGREWQAMIKKRVAGSGCPRWKGHTSWTTTHPKLAREYSPRNLIPAEQVRSSEKVWWRCSKRICRYEWQQIVGVRIAGYGCPACTNQVVTARNNLAKRNPKLAKEYSPRNPLPAHQVQAGTESKFWWKCSKCRHEWLAACNKRMKGGKCPGCLNRVVTKSNNLAAQHPKLAREYSTRNPLPANQVIATKQKFWWKCSNTSCGHEWKSAAYTRVTKRSGCPSCSAKRKRGPRK